MATIPGLDIRDESGTALSVLDTFYNGEWHQAINAADSLKFACPLTESDDLQLGNMVYLRRGDDAELVRKFVIVRRVEISGERAECQIECMDLAVLLLQSAIINYPESGPVNENSDTEPVVNVLDFIAGVLEYAEDTGINLVTIPGDLGSFAYSDLRVTNSNVWAALHKARELVGHGMLWVDNDKGLHWYDDRFPAHNTYRLEPDRNLVSISKYYDGITGEESNKYSVDVIDLSAHTGEDDGMLNIGMPVIVVMPDESEETLYITEITQSLDTPMQCRISLAAELYTSGRPIDILDEILSMKDATNADKAFRDDTNAWRWALEGLGGDQSLRDWLDGLNDFLNDLSLWGWGEEIQDQVDSLELTTTNFISNITDTVTTVVEEIFENPTTSITESMQTIVENVFENPTENIVNSVNNVVETIFNMPTETLIEEISQAIMYEHTIEPVAEESYGGLKNTAARGDHVHAIPFGNDIQGIGIENNSGSSSQVARVDHVHSYGVELVAALPSIPSVGTLSVIWGTSTQITGGNGDGQVWTACAGQDRWYPSQGVYTTLTGGGS